MFLNVTVHIGIFALGENSTLHKILLFMKQYICNFCLYHKSAGHSWRHSRRVTRNKVRKRKRERKREGEREGRRLVVEGHRLDSNPRPLQWRHSLCTYCKAHATPTEPPESPVNYQWMRHLHILFQNWSIRHLCLMLGASYTISPPNSKDRSVWTTNVSHTVNP